MRPCDLTTDQLRILVQHQERNVKRFRRRYFPSWSKLPRPLWLAEVRSGFGMAAHYRALGENLRRLRQELKKREQTGGAM